MKILGFAGSSSLKSINKSLVKYALSQFDSKIIELVDLNDFEVSIYSIDKENDSGIPKKIHDLVAKIEEADLLVISLAEHNSSYSAAFKNVYDWMSRITNRTTLGDKPVLLMSTSPGGRGGASVLAAASDRFARDGSEIKGVFSLPNYYDLFDVENGVIKDSEKDKELLEIIKSLQILK